MTQYLLSIYQPDGPAPDPEFLEPIMRDLAALNHEMQAAGAWVFAAGLHPAEYRDSPAAQRRRDPGRPTGRSPKARSTSADSP